MKKESFLSIVIIAMLLLTSTANATVFPMKGQIIGNITTPDGEVVSGAEVTAKKTITGEQLNATTDSDGGFVIEQVPSGIYEITYSYNGEVYSHYKRVVVANGFIASVDIKASEKVSTHKFLEIKAQNVADIGEEVPIKVINLKTGESINDSEVYVRGTSVSIGQKSTSVVINYGEPIGKTDENGNISYTFNESGRYFIRASKAGYSSDFDRIIIRSQQLQPSITLKGNVKLNASDDYIFGYSVNGTEFLSLVDVDTSIVTGEKTGVKSRFETGKLKISVHDNVNGILNFKAKDDTTVVIEISDSASIEKESDKKVTVKSEDMEGTIMIAGGGSVSVKDGTITVELEKNSQLIFKVYPEEKDSGDDEIEDGIISGNLSAEIQVFKDGTNKSDSIEYSSEIEIASIYTTNENISITIDSSTELSKTIVITIDNSKLPADPGDLSIKVDGERTVQVSSTDELYATGADDESRSMVVIGDKSTKVFVAVNHFSKRTITIEENEGLTEGAAGQGSKTTSSTDLDKSNEAPTEVPGFEGIFAIVGFLAVAYILRKGR